MGDRLTGIPALIHNHAETTIFEAEVTGNLDRHHEEVPGKRRVRFIKFRDPTDVANRDNEDVRRCLWGEIVKRNGGVVPVNDFCRDLTSCDSAKNAFGHRGASSLVTAPSG